MLLIRFRDKHTRCRKFILIDNSGEQIMFEAPTAIKKQEWVNAITFHFEVAKGIAPKTVSAVPHSAIEVLRATARTIIAPFSSSLFTDRRFSLGTIQCWNVGEKTKQFDHACRNCVSIVCIYCRRCCESCGAVDRCGKSNGTCCASARYKGADRTATVSRRSDAQRRSDGR
jgi:hypothetical protein